MAPIVASEVVEPLQFKDIEDMRAQVVQLVIDRLDELELPTADVIEDAIETVCRGDHSIRQELWGTETLAAIEDALFGPE